MLSSVGGNHRLFSIRLRYRTSTGTDVLMLAATSNASRTLCVVCGRPADFHSAKSNTFNLRKTKHIRIPSSPVRLAASGVASKRRPIIT